jgi:hypothetical protein
MDFTGGLANAPFLIMLSHAAIAAIAAMIFIQKRRFDFRSSLYFLLIGASFFSMAAMNLLVFLGLPVPYHFEISAIHTLFWSLLFALIIARISGMNRLKSMTVLVLASIFIAFSVSMTGWVLMAMFLGYYLSAISFFVLFVFSTRRVKNSGIYGQLAAFISTFLAILGISPMNAMWVVPNILLAVGFAYFMKFGLAFNHFVRPYKLELINRDGEGRIISPWKPFSYIFSYMLLLNITIFVTSTGLHEFGHLAVGRLLGCSGGTVVLIDLLNPSLPGPYTSLLCPPSIQENIIPFLGLSGFAFIIPFGLLFLLLRRFPEKNLSYVIFGMGFILASMDFLLIIPESIVLYASTVLGMAFICIGEIFLVNDYISYERQKKRAVEFKAALKGKPGAVKR